METATEIEITDIGPIERLVIPLPKDGGVTQLLGSQGVGKSTATRASAALLKGHKGADLTRRDGTPLGEQGVIQCGELRITVGKIARMTGMQLLSELEIKEIESRFDLQQLVDPGLKDQAAADRARIKALIGLTGVEPRLELFRELMEPFTAFDNLVSDKTTNCSDLCDMAKALRDDLHAAARRCKSTADIHEGQALACRHAGDELDLEVETDSVRLETELSDALRNQGQVGAEREAAAEWQKAHVAAIGCLAEATANYTGPSVDEAGGTHKQAAVTFMERQAVLDKAIETVRRLQAEVHALDAGNDKAGALHLAAKQHAATLDAFRNTIEQPGPDDPGRDAQPDADESVDAARRALETGAVVREALATQQQAKQHDVQAERERKRAEQLRTAARGTDDVLSAAVPKGVLRVQGERLVLDTPRGETYFAELSDGERWIVAIDLSLAEMDRLGVKRSTALLTIPQHGWQHLSPKNRQLIHRHAQKKGVNILASQVDDGELRAETMETSGA